MSVKAGLPPVAQSDARLLILGSLPGDASLAAQRYYAHPTNQFWRLLGAVIGEELQALDYADRLVALTNRRIALWDVIASATRPGSLDQAIRHAQHNQIDRLVLDLPQLEAIAFNGGTAASIGHKLIGKRPDGLEIINLPSSSAANTKSFADKLNDWRRLAQFVSPAQIGTR